MPNTILKRWNGSAFEELYPKTITSQIAASGSPSISTFLRGDGQWATPSDTTTLTGLGITATAAELNFVDGVTSAIQTQLNGKAATSHTHTASQISDRGNIGNNLMVLQDTTTATRFLKLNPNHSVSLESDSVFKTSLGLSNVTNESKATMFSSPTFTGTVSGVTAAMVGAAPTAGSTSITTLGTVTTGTWSASTIALTRGGTGTTTAPNAGGVVFGNTGGGSYISTATPSALTQYLGVTGGANNQPAWTSPGNASVRTVLSSSTTTLVTEQEVYWGTRYMHIGVTSVAGQNVNRTLTFTAGMKNFILQLHQDTTTGAVIARLPLTISGNVGTSADAVIDSLDVSTSPVTHRISWSNGSATQIMNLTISYVAATRVVTMSQSFNFNCAFRLFGF